MANWGYAQVNGPNTWASVAPAAKGKRQSPIDIKPAQAQCDEGLKSNPLKWTYVPTNSKTLLNTGKSVQVVTEHAGSSLTGGPLKNKFEIAQFHFHWGKTDCTGSEHTVDGKMYSAELHLVHYNTDKFSEFGSAAQEDNGLTVLGIFLQVGKEHPGLKKLTDLFPKIPNSGDSVALSAFDPACLLPEDTTKYWTYPGSLTTPPCFESVNWIVFKNPIEVSEDQLQAFRGLLSESRDVCMSNDSNGHAHNGTVHNDGDWDHHIAPNYRPTQPLNEREVQASFRKFFV